MDHPPQRQAAEAREQVRLQARLEDLPKAIKRKEKALREIAELKGRASSGPLNADQQVPA
jgi:hypothetical protein